MANKRMFSLMVIDTDAFLDMPLSTQALYFHLNMRADDDGFIGSPKTIARTVGASEDDLKLLVAKRFVLVFEDGVIVIKHWRMHNTLSKDRYKETNYIEDKQFLRIKENNAYTLSDEGKPLDDTKKIESGKRQTKKIDAQQTDERRTTDAQQTDTDKNRIDKNRIEQLDGGRYNVTTGNNNVTDDVVEICNLIEKNFNRTISPIEYEKIQAWLEDFDKDILIKAINESVFNNKKTFSYINGILRNWKTNNDLPEWFGKDIQSQEPTPEEKREMEDIINNF